jgi:cytidylate kinase
MPIVTIRGQYGSGAPEIGKAVADRLHIDYIDREVIARVAERLNERTQDVIAKEMPPSSLWGRIAHALGFDYGMAMGYPLESGFVSSYPGAYLPAWQMPLDDTRYLSGLESVIKELARNQLAVIRGRGSQFILKDHPGALHVLVVAPLALRVQHIMQTLAVDKEAAEKEIAQMDGSRRAFIKRYFQAEIEDPLNYDIVLNTERLDYESAASVIISAIPFKDPTALRTSEAP